LITRLIVFLVDHDAPVFIRVEPIFNDFLELLDLLFFELFQFQKVFLGEALDSFNLAHQTLNVNVNILILIIHRLWERTWTGPLAELREYCGGLLVQGHDVSTVTAGARSSALLLHVANSWRSVRFGPTRAAAILGAVLASITRFVRFVFLKVLVKFLLVLIKINIFSKKEVITDEIVFLEVSQISLFFSIRIFKTFLHFNLIFVLSSPRFIRSLHGFCLSLAIFFTVSFLSLKVFFSCKAFAVEHTHIKAVLFIFVLRFLVVTLSSSFIKFFFH
jgi:hypothetical protein